MKSTLKITSPELITEARLEESKLVEERIEALAKSGANVVFTEKGIDDIGMHYLAKKGIFAVRRCKEEEIKKIVKATGARVVSKVDGVEALKILGKQILLKSVVWAIIRWSMWKDAIIQKQYLF